MRSGTDGPTGGQTFGKLLFLIFLIENNYLRIQQYFPKIREEKCAVSCTTLDGQFLRYPQMVHQHDPPTKGKKLFMQFVDRVATEVPKSNQQLQRIWEKNSIKIFR